VIKYKSHSFRLYKKKQEARLPLLVVQNPVQRHIILTKTFKKTHTLKQIFKQLYVLIFSGCDCAYLSTDIKFQHALLSKKSLKLNRKFNEDTLFYEDSAERTLDVKVEFIQMRPKPRLNSHKYHQHSKQELSNIRRHSEQISSDDTYLLDSRDPYKTVEILPDADLQYMERSQNHLLHQILNFNFRIKE
jgi:hypothetical protein